MSTAKEQDKENAVENTGNKSNETKTPLTPVSTTVNGRKGKIISFFVPDESPGDMVRIETETSQNPSKMCY